MNDKYLKEIYRAITAVKGDHTLNLNPDSTLIDDLGFESIDVLDLAFEIQTATGIPIDFTKLILAQEHLDGRRFNDLRIADLQKYLLKHA